MVFGAALLAVGVATWAFPSVSPRVNRVVSFAQKASTVRIRDLRACRCPSRSEARFARADGLEIAASLYTDAPDEPRPSVLLLHGNTPLGRRLAFYRVLATKLVERGYLVLTIDLAGFGESGDPYALDTLDALDPALDAIAALDVLDTLPAATPDLTIIGHSGGSGGALRAGLPDPRVSRIVLIGPPRRNTERLEDPSVVEYFWRRHQNQRLEVFGSPFPDWYTFEAWIELILPGDLELYRPELSVPGHKPLFLLDGELEDQRDREYLSRYYDQLAEPKAYATIPNANHYSNSRDFWGLAVYDRVAMTHTVELIDGWIRR